MARKTVTYLIDDLDGSEIPQGTSSTTFALNGATWSIDLAPANVDKLQEALAPFIDKATRISGGSATAPARKRGGSGANTPQFLAAVREWAPSAGYSVGERGRIKSEIIDAYRNAH